VMGKAREHASVLDYLAIQRVKRSRALSDLEGGLHYATG
jgi:hypothetical protein